MNNTPAAVRDDGGPAFPCDEKNGDGSHYHFNPGMSMRDHFAGLAMQAQVMTDMVPGQPCEELLAAAERAGQDPVYRLALNSYEIADAMLKARKA